MKKATVIGAGISGLSISRMLKNDFEVQVLEKNNKAGGLIKCDRIDGNLFHRVGGHVFNSKNRTVLDWFWQHFDRDQEFLQATRNAKILFGDKLVGYPLENYLYQLPENITRPILEELLYKLAEGDTLQAAYNNFEEFLLGNFGEGLYNLYFGPYNTKIWNTDLKQVPLEWLDGKLPMPQVTEVIISNIIRKEETGMVHATFYYPVQNGSQFIIDRLAQGLDIEYSFKVDNIVPTSSGGLSVNRMPPADVVIYCGDVRQLHQVIKIDDDDLSKALEDVKDLASNGTSNVLCETDDNDLSWLYLPEAKYKAHRIIYTGNFSQTNNQGSLRKTCVVEFSGKHDQQEMVNELANLPGNLKPLAFNYEPNSYIIHDKRTAKKIADLKAQLAKYNIFLLGRFAEWEYYNMDKCIEAAMALQQRLSAPANQNIHEGISHTHYV